MVERERQPLGYYYHPIELPEDFPVYLQYSYIQSDEPIVELHSHNTLEIGFCHEGNGVFNIRNEFQPYATGDVSIVSQDEVHLAQSRKGTDSRWTFLFIDADALLLPYYREILKTPLTNFRDKRAVNSIISGTEYPEISRAVDRIVDELRFKKAFYKLTAISLIIQLLVDIHRLREERKSELTEGVQEKLDGAALERIAPAVQYIHTCYSRKIKIDDLAKICFMSPRAFSRSFKRVFDKAPIEFLLELRLAIACNELKNSDHPISLISDSCGFMSQSSFNRQFQRLLGTSPREWRKKQKI